MLLLLHNVYNNRSKGESIILQKNPPLLHQDALSCKKRHDAAGSSKVRVSWQKQ